MTKRNLCDICLHHAVCRHGIAQQWGRMAHCAYYERLILMGHTPGLLPLWVRTATPPEEGRKWTHENVNGSIHAARR